MDRHTDPALADAEAHQAQAVARAADRDKWTHRRELALVRQFDDLRSAVVSAWASPKVASSVELLAYDFACWLQESQPDPAHVVAELLVSPTQLGRYAALYAGARARSECGRLPDDHFDEPFSAYVRRTA